MYIKFSFGYNGFAKKTPPDPISNSGNHQKNEAISAEWILKFLRAVLILLADWLSWWQIGHTCNKIDAEDLVLCRVTISAV